MKIITPGKIQEEQTRRWTCRKCTCVFEFAEFEAERISDQRDGDLLKVNCPECTRTNWIAL